MSLALLLARLVLAAVFMVAGLAKLADLAGSQQAMRDFGLSAPLARPSGVLLPLAELAVAVALIIPDFAWGGALGALTLLLLFVAGISYNLAHGRTPNCHCFGQLHSTPAGRSTLLRNLVLAAIAVFVVGVGRTTVRLSPFDWFGSLTITQRIELFIGVILLGLLALGSWLLLQIMRQQGRLLLRLETLEQHLADNGLALPSVPAIGLAVGTPAPTFSLTPLSSNNQSTETVTLEELQAKGKPVVLVFSDSDCGPCTALLPEISRWQHNYTGRLTLALISRGTADANRTKASQHGITQVLLQQNNEVAEMYHAYRTPGAVLVHPDGTIGSPLAQGADAIRTLVVQTVTRPARRMLPLVVSLDGDTESQSTHLKVGEPAPDLTLPDLRGKNINLSDFRGGKTLVLFWDPNCGFCQRMLDDLKAWEANPPNGAPGLRVISTGTVAANKALGLRSTILLDEGACAGQLFGATGTPMAVLLDANGTIASEVVAGAPAVLALAGVPGKNSAIHPV